MPDNIDPTALVNLPCPACAQKTAVSVATLQTAPRIRCESCGTTFAVNVRKVMDKVRAAQEQADMERRRRGV
jgi:transcription elongation factor Elf1